MMASTPKAAAKLEYCLECKGEETGVEYLCKEENMIIETNDIHGNARIINPSFITNIEYAVVGNRLSPTGRSIRGRCAGAQGDQMIRLWMSTGQVIEISGDHDGVDVTAGVLRCYKSMMCGIKPENAAVV